MRQGDKSHNAVVGGDVAGKEHDGGFKANERVSKPFRSWGGKCGESANAGGVNGC